MKLPLRLAPLFLVLTEVASAAVAWKATPTDGAFATSTNWVGNVAPVSTDSLQFGASSQSSVVFSAHTSVTGIMIDNTGGAFPPYVFSTGNSSKLSIGSSGISVATGGATTVTFQSSLPLGLTADQTWTAGDAVTLTVAGEVSGAFNLTKAGGGTLILSGTNSYSGTTTISSGYLLIGAGNGLGQLPVSPTANNLTISGGSLATSANVSLHANRGVTLGAGHGSFDVGSGTTLTIAGAVTGPGQLYVNPTGGTLELSGANSFSGAATVFGGGTGTTLRASHATALGSTAGGTTVGFGARLDINGAAVGAEPVTLTGAGAGGLGALTGTGTASLSGPITLSGSASIGGTGTLTLSGTIGESGGPAALTKVGAGTLVLSNAMSYTGGTTISAGTLRLAENGALATTGNLSLSPLAGTSATFDVNGLTRTIGALGFSGAATNSTSTVSIGAGTLTLGGDVTYNAANNPGMASISGGTLNLGGTRTFDVGNSSTATNDLTISSAITSSAGEGIQKTGAGTLSLSNSSNSYAGLTWIEEGKVVVSSLAASGTNSGLGAGSLVRLGSDNLDGTLEVRNPGSVTTNRTIDLGGTSGGGTLLVNSSAPITLSGNVTASGAGSKALTLGGFGTSATLAGSIANNSPTNLTSVVKQDFGTWTLSGANTYTGSTTVRGGTLRTATNGALGVSSNVELQPSGQGYVSLDLGNTEQTIGSLNFGGSGYSAVWLNSPGKLTLGGTVTGSASGSADIYGGTVALGSANLVEGARVFHVEDSINAYTEVSVFSTLSGTVPLQKTGKGALFLGGNSSSFGAGVHVTDGQLLLGSNSSAGTGPLQMFTGTRLAPRHSDVELTNEVTLANNTFLGDYDEGRSLTFAGTVTLQPAGESNAAVLTLDRETQIRFGGSLTAPAGTTLYFSGSSPALFSGPTSANIGTIWTTGPSLGFLTTRALPAVLRAASGAYVGVLATSSAFLSEVAPGAVAADPVTLLGRIATGVDASTRAAAAASFGGTIGFDSDRDHLKASAVFGQTLDFTSFTHPDFAVGSASLATLSGTIMPVATAPGQFNYAFGNGGGMLVVQSNLTGNASVTVSSQEDRSLITVLRGNNSFAGNLNIHNSAVILDSARALPHRTESNGTTGRNVSISGGLMYFGATEARATAAETVSLFASVVSNTALGNVISSEFSPVSIIGLDSREFLDAVLAGRDSDRVTRVIEGGPAINLAGFFDAPYVGTLTRVSIMDSLLGKNYDGTVHFGVTGVKGGHLTIGSIIGGSGSDVQQLHVGSGSLGEQNGIVELTGANVHQNTLLEGGVLRVGYATALGSGTLIVEGGYGDQALASNSTTGYTLANAINLNGVDLQLGEKGSTVFGSGSRRRNTLTLTGAINGNGYLHVVNGRTTLAPAGAVVNGYTGTFAENGGLIFGNALARPNGTANLSSYFEGYIGIGYLPESLQSEFINFFDSGYTYGTIGFDSLGAETNLFAGAINLASLFSSPRLGSSTVAELRGAITPGNSGYAFGGGGGTLYVASALTGSRPLRVESSNVAPLTLWLTNTANTYSGYTTVEHSALVFGAGAVPTVSNIGVEQGGYVGTASSADLSTFFARFSNSTHTDRFVGFDATGTDTHVFSSPLVLTGTPIPNFYVGTTTNLLFTSTSGIVTPSGTYRLAGYKGGAVTLEFPIAAGSVIVGEPNTPATHGTESVRSSVTLTGSSTFTGGTTLHTGTLAVGHNNALGTGALTVAGNYFGGNVSPLLVASVSGIQLSNNVVLDAELYIGSANTLTLSGVVSGSHELYKIGTGDLFLTGANTFTGGVYIAQGKVVFQNAASMGQGPLQFGFTFPASASFLEDTTIQGIFSDSIDKAIGTTAGKTLSINQTFNSSYAGAFLGTGTLVFKNTSGTPTRLRLSRSSSGLFYGTSRIESGVTVIAAHNDAFGLGAVEINGGKLAADSNRVISNPLVLTAGSLGGTGTFAPAATLTIGTNVALAPGTGTGPAALNFSNAQLGGASAGIVLTLAGGGTYQWQFMEGSGLSGLQPADGRWDTVTVTGGVNVTATSDNRFTFKLTTIASDGNLGLAGNFNNLISQSWTVLNATSITGFNTASFALDTTSFQNSLNGGVFSLGLNGGNSLVLNFAAVPEPSTYALLGAGLLVVIALRRRKRA